MGFLMRINFRTLRNPQIVARVAADFLLVHLAAVASLSGVLVWRLADAPATDPAQLAAGLRWIYLHRFVPLSVVFPAVFALTGFYSRMRSYPPPYKWRVIGTGSAMATVIYLFLDFLLNRADVIPRSSTLLFLGFVVLGTVGSRWLKHWLIGERKPITAEASRHPQPPVLVVGGAGYIGSLLCRQLLEKGYRVRVLDRLLYGNRAIVDLLGDPRLELIEGDCRSIQSVVAAVSGVSAIIHLAAIVGDPACEQDRETALEINYAATRMLIEVARGQKVARFIFASSCSVYGETDLLMTESSAVHPISLYAQTKLDSEAALIEACDANFHPVILRLGTVFGCSFRNRFDLVVNLLCAKAHSEGLITVYNGDQWRPFIHVADVARGLIAALEAPLDVVSGQIFNLGDSRLNHTLRELAQKVRAILPDTKIEEVQNPDRRNYRVAFDRIRNELGFECRMTLEDGIREMVQLLDAGQVGDYGSPQFHNQKFLKAIGSPVSRSVLDARVMAAFSGAPPAVQARTASAN
jgi:nucleoside-diphosphate-sugar epimerase